MTATPPPPGWYPNPSNPHEMSYWNGQAWAPPPSPQMPAYTSNLPEPGRAANPLSAHTATRAAGAPSSRKWLIAGAVIAGIVVTGTIGNAIGRAASNGPEVAPVAVPTVTVTADPIETSPPPVVAEDAPTPSAAPIAVAADPVAFRAQSGSHLDDMLVDLEDIIVTVEEDGFWRLLSNSGELAFNLGQLEALDVPTSVAATWPGSLSSLEASLDVLSDAITTEDSTSILAAVEGVRAQIEATRGVASSAV